MRNETEILKRLTDVEARLAALDGKAAVMFAPKPAPAEEGARITTIHPASSFAMPQDAEMRQLLKFAIVRLTQMDRAPDFSAASRGRRVDASREEKQDEFYRQFCAAFQALGAIARASELNKKRAFTYWVGTAEEILRTCQYSSVPGSALGLALAPAFLAAVIAHGDILFNDAREFPYVLEFGLCDYGGKPATDAWRKILTAGSAPGPTAVKAPFFRAG